MAQPDIYEGYNNVKTGRILAIIGVILSGLYLLLNIVLVAIYGWDGMQEMVMESMEVYQNQ